MSEYSGTYTHVYKQNILALESIRWYIKRLKNIPAQRLRNRVRIFRHVRPHTQTKYS